MNIRRTIDQLGLVGLGAILLSGCCAFANHKLAYPNEPPPQVMVWSADFQRDQLRAHVEGARPRGPGPFPTIIVHPEEDETATAMHGVIWDLAQRGYLALAFDYTRLIKGEYRRTLYAWQSTDDIRLPFDVTQAYPEADQNRLGALGFSEGGVLSLMLAAHYPDRLKAVVCYYPITDFPRWYAGKRSGWPRVLFGLARWQLRTDFGRFTDSEFDQKMRLASPYYMAEYITAPVLLIHGAEDTLALPEESERMAESLQAAGKTTKLILVADAGRLFNFSDAQQAAAARDASQQWLDTYLRAPTNPNAAQVGAR